MKIQLSDAEVTRYKRSIRGRGGFQVLLRKLSSRIASDGTLELSDSELEKLVRYSFQYGGGGFQERTKPTAKRIAKKR